MLTGPGRRGAGQGAGQGAGPRCGQVFPFHARACWCLKDGQGGEDGGINEQ